jgi:hypothetical protein
MRQTQTTTEKHSVISASIIALMLVLKIEGEKFTPQLLGDFLQGKKVNAPWSTSDVPGNWRQTSFWWLQEKSHKGLIKKRRLRTKKRPFSRHL